MQDRHAHWEERWRRVSGGAVPDPARVLAENLHLLPARGRALDLACGLAGNAFALAAHGLETHAWDWSEAAIARVRGAVQGGAPAVRAAVRDVVAQPPEPDAFDVIVVAHFLDRTLMPRLEAALRPGGLLFYQTFVREAVGERGPSRPEYRLGPNELLALLPALRLVVYREEGRIGDLSRGFRDEVLYVGRRPD